MKPMSYPINVTAYAWVLFGTFSLQLVIENAGWVGWSHAVCQRNLINEEAAAMHYSEWYIFKPKRNLIGSLAFLHRTLPPMVMKLNYWWIGQTAPSTVPIKQLPQVASNLKLYAYETSTSKNYFFLKNLCASAGKMVFLWHYNLYSIRYRRLYVVKLTSLGP